MTEVRSLMQGGHDFLTLVIDPSTTLFNDALDDAEAMVGSEFGRHYGMANKQFKRLCGLLTSPELDMNVIVTAHEKNEYGPKLEVIDKTFDGFKKLDYMFDLWLRLYRNGTGPSAKRFAQVYKTRLSEFPDRDDFEWSYAELLKRFGKDRIEKGVEGIDMATAEQVGRFNSLMARLSDDEKKKLKLSKLENIEDMPAERLAKGIELIEKHLAKAAA